MTQRLLRHKPTGELYVYQDIYAIRPDFEDVEDPNVIDVEAKELPTPKRTKKIAATALTVEDEVSRLLEDA
jgi:hypothetical protein